MGRLFTYMVKAAAGEQPYTEDQYAAWLADGAGFDSQYYHPAMEQRILEDEKKFAREVAREPMAGLGGRSRRASLRRFQRLVANVRNQQRSRGATYITNTLSQGGTLQPWAVDHLQKGYGITNDLLKNERFQKYISEVNADNQSDVRNAFMAMGITWDPKTSDYRDPAFIKSLQEGIRAGKWKPAAPVAPEPAPEPAPTEPATTTVTPDHAPATGSAMKPANEGGVRPVSSSEQSPAPLKSVTAPDVAASVQKPGGRVGPMVRDAVRWGLYALQPKLKVRDTIQQNLAEGKSMYDGMTASTPGMTPGQIQALRARGFVGNPQQQAAALAAAQENAAKNGMTLPNSEHDAYTGAGLRMVGHSADGRTRTYVGKSGRGRITVGDDAGSGYHYRGNGNIDRNVQSNYADLRQPNTQRPGTPPQIKSPRR